MQYLNEYQSFINEKLILELLLESNVIYSTKFTKALSKMPNNDIAKKLLEIENKDLEVVSNFFDIKIDNDNILTFTSDRIAQAILSDDKEFFRYTGRRGGWLTHTPANKKIFISLGFEPTTEEVFQPNNTDKGELINKVLSPKSGKTWCYVKFPTGEGVYSLDKLASVVVDKNQIIFNKNRQEIRIGRAIRVLLRAYKVQVIDSVIETFVNEFRAVLSVMNNVFSRFEIVEGEDLVFWYSRDNYRFPRKGNLGSSCQAIGRRDWLEIYMINPEVVKLLILKSEDRDDKIIGRALLWKLDDGRTLMDVIYVSNDSDSNVYKEYAKSKGLTIMSYSDTYITHIKPGELDYYPSIDTMNNLDSSTGKISNKYFPGSVQTEWDDDGEDNWEGDGEEGWDWDDI